MSSRKTLNTLVAFIIAAAILSSAAFAAAPNPGHTASQISGGTFSTNDGAFTFPVDVIMGTGSQLDFYDEAGDKAYWYSNIYGTGIESNTLTDWSQNRHRWRIGGNSVSTGTEYMNLTSAGLHVVGDLIASGGDINLVRGDLSSIHRVGNISFDWTAGSYDNSAMHGIESKTEGGGLSGSMRLNSYADITMTIDSNGNSVSSFIVQKESTGDGTNLFRVNESGHAWFGTGGMYWDNTLGRLGIGTTLPNATLHVVGNATIDGTTFNVNSISHRVGIGTSSPIRLLQVNGDTQSNNYFVTAGATFGLGFWGSAVSTYGISMGTTTYFYGDVTDYYIANVMSSGTGRGFVWSYGAVPSMSLNANSGNLTIKGVFKARGSGNNFFSGKFGINTTDTSMGTLVVDGTSSSNQAIYANASNENPAAWFENRGGGDGLRAESSSENGMVGVSGSAVGGAYVPDRNAGVVAWGMGGPGIWTNGSTYGIYATSLSSGKAGYFAGNTSTTIDFCIEGGACLSTAGSSTVGGSGTANSIPKWTTGTTLGDSAINESATIVSINNKNLTIGADSYIDDDTTLGGNNDDWIKLSGYLEMKSNTNSYGIVLRATDSGNYLGMTQVGGAGYLADTNAYTRYFLKGDGRNATAPNLTAENNLMVDGNLLFADSYNNMVGIGTASPVGKLNSYTTTGIGVNGTTTAVSGNGYGVYGKGGEFGVVGTYGTVNIPAYAGHAGVIGSASDGYAGVYGEGTAGLRGAGSTYGAYLTASSGIAVWGEGLDIGVRGNGTTGVWGYYSGNPNNYGELGTGAEGVHGYSASGNGITAESVTGLAGKFIGHINVTKTIYYGGNLTGYGADFAEMFTAAAPVESGDVVCLNDDMDIIRCSQRAQPGVVGIVSENPTIMGNAANGDTPVAIVGIVTTKVKGSIARFDLLTSSTTPGYAERATINDFGAIIGKAMEPCAKDECVIKVLVGLR